MHHTIIASTVVQNGKKCCWLKHPTQTIGIRLDATKISHFMSQLNKIFLCFETLYKMPILAF